MYNHLFRCSSIGKLMTENRSKSDGELSVGAKTYVRQLAWEQIIGIESEISGKEIEKGLRVEEDSIQLLNNVRGLSLKKNNERKNNGFITGECDLFDEEIKRGHDIKSAWSIRTFNAFYEDCYDKLYEWQMRGYMMLWDADEWEVNYCLVDTPEDLIRYEAMSDHIVSWIPEHMRLTTWNIKRDKALEERIIEKVLAARAYMHECILEFDATHQPLIKEAA